MPRPPYAVTLLALLAPGCFGSTPPAEPPPEDPADTATASPAPLERVGPDILLVTIDTTRADRLGAYGDPLAKTPVLDGLAAEGALFRSAWTTVPLTLPAHASLLTGRYPHQHGIRDNGGHRLDDEVPTLAAQLATHGYATGAAVGSYVLDATWGLDRGFESYADDFHPVDIASARELSAVERPADEVFADGLSWWRAHEGRSRFLWLHVYDVHHPYESGPDWQGDPYRGELFRVDRALRPVLEAVGDDALVVITSDHGENLWDGGELQHGLVLSTATLRVPLIVRPPGGLKPGSDGLQAPEPRPAPPRPTAWAPPDLPPEGLVLDPVPDAPRAARVVEPSVSLVDLLPTILDYAGAPPDAGAAGRSLRPAIEGGALPDSPVYAETVYPWAHYGWAPGFFATQGGRALVRTPAQRVGDVAADPTWETFVATVDNAPKPEPALAEMLASHSAGWDQPGAAVDGATAAQLQALGYVTATVGKTGVDPSSLPDPRERMPLFHRQLAALEEVSTDPDAALAELEALVAEEPGLIDAWLHIGLLRQDLSDGESALAAYDEVLERDPLNPIALNNKVIVLRGLLRWEDTVELIDTLQALNPDDPRWYRHEADVNARRERPAEVLVACNEGLEAIGDDPFLFYMKGLALLQLGKPAEAIEALKGAKRSGTRALDVDLWLGTAHQDLGQLEEAVDAFLAYAKERPDDLRAVVAAGLILADDLKRCDRALPVLLTARERGARTREVEEAYRACGGS